MPDGYVCVCVSALGGCLCVPCGYAYVLGGYACVCEVDVNIC